MTTSKTYIGIKNPDINYLKGSEFPIMDRYSTGSQISKSNVNDAFKVIELQTKDNLTSDNSNNNIDNDIEEKNKKQIV